MEYRNYLRWLGQLNRSDREMVQDLLRHKAIQRLGSLRHLGFASSRRHTLVHDRLYHTLLTVSSLVSLLDSITFVPAEIKRHLLATAILQDVGHTPFSNSLREAFPLFSPHDNTFELPADRSRTISIISYINESDNLLARHGLEPEIIMELLYGKNPWPAYPWAIPLLDGPLDADRLAYVPADLEAIGQSQSYMPNLLTSLMPRDWSSFVTVNRGGEELVTRFVLQRGSLYANVYQGLTSLALSRLIGSFLKAVWADNLGALDQRYNSPKTPEEFLEWTDESLPRMLDSIRLESPYNNLWRFQHLLRTNGFVAANLSLRMRKENPDVLDSQLEQVDLPNFPYGLFWKIASRELPTLQWYAPSSILVHNRGSYEPLEKRVKIIQNLSQVYRRQPILIFPNTELPKILLALDGSDLQLDKLEKLPTAEAIGLFPETPE